MERNALPIDVLDDVSQRPALVRAALDACASKTDGSPAAAATMRRKRAVLHNFFGHAVELGHLSVNPVGTVQWKVAKVADEVDRRVVLSPAQFAECLAAVSYVGRERGPSWSPSSACCTTRLPDRVRLLLSSRMTSHCPIRDGVW